ncbi:hypothetical protein, partial [Granulicoccus phenolivorans]
DVRGVWRLWTYLSGDADVRARRAVTAYRDRLGAHTPAPLPTPTPTPTPAPAPTPTPAAAPPAQAPTPAPIPTSGGTSAGRYEQSRLPMLATHRGTPPDLVLRWNAMSNPAVIDVVVHLHGYTRRAAAMRLPRDLEKISGLDFADPSGAQAGGRTRPTLGLLPRGSSAPSAKRPDRMVFPALLRPGAIDELVQQGLRIFTARTGVSAPRGRLILTAHSGGGAALDAILKYCDPDEVHVFDALYAPARNLIAWAERRIQREVPAAALLPGALRVIYLGTEKFSTPVRTAVCAALSAAAAAPELARRFRVESTTVAHGDIPREFGWRLLADAGADLPRVRRHVCGTGSAGEAEPGIAASGAQFNDSEDSEATGAFLPVPKQSAELDEWNEAGFALEELEEALEPAEEAWVPEAEDRAQPEVDEEFEEPESYVDPESYV